MAPPVATFSYICSTANLDSKCKEPTLGEVNDNLQHFLKDCFVVRLRRIPCPRIKGKGGADTNIWLSSNFVKSIFKISPPCSPRFNSAPSVMCFKKSAYPSSMS